MGAAGGVNSLFFKKLMIRFCLNKPFVAILFAIYIGALHAGDAFIERNVVEHQFDIVRKLIFFDEKKAIQLTPKGFGAEANILVDICTSVAKDWETVVDSKDLLKNWVPCNPFMMNVPIFVSSDRVVNLLVQASPKGPYLEHLYPGLRGCYPGETVRLKFFTQDKKTIVEEVFEPFPIRSETQDKRVFLSACLDRVKPTQYILTIGGVEEGESFKVTGWASESSKTLTGPKTVTLTLPLQNKRIKRKNLPPLKNAQENSGVHTVTVELQNGQSLAIELPFGASLKPNHQLDKIEKDFLTGALNLFEIKIK